MATETASQAPRRGILRRIPILGRILRECDEDSDCIVYLVVALVSLLIIATVTYGLQVLAMAALFMVPVMFIILIAITLG